MIGLAVTKTWQTAEHKGPGVVLFGGDEESSGTSSDQYFAVVPESEYKRDNYIGYSCIFIVGFLVLAYAIHQQKERNMQHLSPRLKEAYAELNKLSTLELYVEKSREESQINSERKQMVNALIEQRKDRRDFWTLLAAVASAVFAGFALFLDHLYQLQPAVK